MKTDKTKGPWRRVDFVNNVTDARCVLLASVGRSNRSIGGLTGLTVGQIGYRLRKHDATARRRYRDGESEESQMVFSVLERQLAKQLRVEMRQKKVAVG